MTGARSSATERDLQVLRWAGEQWAIPLELVGQVLVELGRSPASAGRAARDTAGRLELLGYAGRRPLQGETWLTPTRAGLRAVGLSYPATVPADGLLQHTATVARLRLWLEADGDAGGSWESERAIRARAVGSVRRPDGAWHYPDGRAGAVEVELSVKEPARYAGIVRDTDPAWDAVWWFTRPEQGELLARRLVDAGGAGRHRVFALPEGSWSP